MNKQGHLLVSRKVMDGKFEQHRFWLLLGSILPDILVHTYLEGHTWNATFSKNSRRMEKLSELGKINWYSCLALGWLLHYVEDYFTCPHNEGYTGSLTEHIAYERELLAYLCKEPDQEGGWEKSAAADVKTDISALAGELNKLHIQYLQMPRGYENDGCFIEQAAGLVTTYFAAAFERNQKLSDMAAWEFTGIFEGTFPSFSVRRHL